MCKLDGGDCCVGMNMTEYGSMTDYGLTIVVRRAGGVSGVVVVVADGCGGSCNVGEVGPSNSSKENLSKVKLSTANFLKLNSSKVKSLKLKLT